MQDEKHPSMMHVQVLKKGDGLRRYAYCMTYVTKVLQECRDTLPTDSDDLILDLRSDVTLYHLSKAEVDTAKTILEILRDPMPSPSLYVIHENEFELIHQDLGAIERKLIVLIQRESKTDKNPCSTEGTHIIAYTTKDNLIDDADKALERYVFSFLKTAMERINPFGKHLRAMHSIF